jgi:transposase-like protein
MTKLKRPRHVHLGLRLDTVERIRSGRATIEECARDLGVAPQVIREWLERHGGDRPTSIGEVLQGSERFVLERRVERMRECLAKVEREVARLHKQLVAALA